MSTSLNVMTAKKFDQLIGKYEQVKHTEKYNTDPIGVLMDMLDEFTQYYTNFSGNIGRLYDVVLEGEHLQMRFLMNMSAVSINSTKKIFSIS